MQKAPTAAIVLRMIVFIVNYGKREYRTMKTEKVRAFKWKDFCGGHENFNVQFPTRNVYVAICRNKKNTNISLSLSLSFSFFLFFSLSLSLQEAESVFIETIRHIRTRSTLN